MPPIYQPELAADAVLWASRNRRQEVYVGTPSVGTILGNKLLPGVVERYLARTGYDSQQTDEPEDPDRPDYLTKPVPGDHGAHGSFDDQAHRHDPQFWATKNRGWIALAGAGLAGAALLALKRA